jgi:protein-tyrosine phosphatase
VEALRACNLIDGSGNDPWLVRQLVNTLDKFVKQHPKVLVHCQAGRSRSVVVVAAWLMRTKKLSPADSLAFIAKSREIALTPGIEHLLYNEVW